MKEPLNLTKEEQDLLLDILLKEVDKVSELNATAQLHLAQYRKDVLGIYHKVVDSMDED